MTHDDDLIGFACTRGCANVRLVPRDELADDGGGDPDLTPELVPRPGWLIDDDQLVVCFACATPAEVQAEQDGILAAVEAGDRLAREHDEQQDDPW